MIFPHLHQWIGIAWLMTAVVTGLLRGGWPERVAAVVMTVAWFSSGVVQDRAQVWGPQVAIMAIDLALLAFLLALALRTDRWWPMWATGFHGLGVLVHIALAVDPKIWSRPYFIAQTVFSFLTVLALFVGAIARPARKPVQA